jgi:hypothetical protein
MVGTIGRTRGSSRWLSCIILVATIGVQQASAQEGGASGDAARKPKTAAAVSRVRAADSGARAVLVAGMATSATFRMLVETLERSDLVIYVEARALKLSGQLQFVGATSGGRYIRIAVQIPGREDELAAWLAHELWHAVEIAQAPEVRSQASLAALYRRIGSFDISGYDVETKQAQVVQLQVLKEFAAGAGQTPSPAVSGPSGALGIRPPAVR